MYDALLLCRWFYDVWPFFYEMKWENYKYYYSKTYCALKIGLYLNVNENRYESL